MGSTGFVENIVSKRLMDLHCAYIGRVAWTDGETATVQPLGLIKQNGSTTAKAQAVVQNVPIACKYKLSTKDIAYIVDNEGNKRTTTVAVPEPIASGDIVVCICADRDITAARRGKNELPPAGNHSITDSVIVGIL